MQADTTTDAAYLKGCRYKQLSPLVLISRNRQSIVSPLNGVPPFVQRILLLLVDSLAISSSTASGS